MTHTEEHNNEHHDHGEHELKPGEDPYSHFHGRYRFDEPFFGPDDDKPAMRISQEELNEHRVKSSFRDVCAHRYLVAKRCYMFINYLPWLKHKCEHEYHNYHACLLEDYKRRLRLLMRDQLGKEFLKYYAEKKEEFYQHQKLVRDVAKLIQIKEERDKLLQKAANN